MRRLVDFLKIAGLLALACIVILGGCFLVIRGLVAITSDPTPPVQQHEHY